MKTIGHCTVRNLLDAIERLKKHGCSQEEIDNMPVYIQRIEDVYFNELNWKTNTRVCNHYGDTTQYIEAFSPVLIKDDNGNYEFCIDAHY